MKTTDLLDIYFNRHGRMGRLQYLEAMMGVILGFCLSFIFIILSVFDVNLRSFDLIEANPNLGFLLLSSALFIFSTILSIAPFAKRCHDLGFHGLWAFVLIFILGVYFVYPDFEFLWLALYPGYFTVGILFFFIPGSPNKNKWGEP